MEPFKDFFVSSLPTLPSHQLHFWLDYFQLEGMLNTCLALSATEHSLERLEIYFGFIFVWEMWSQCDSNSRTLQWKKKMDGEREISQRKLGQLLRDYKQQKKIQYNWDTIPKYVFAKFSKFYHSSTLYQLQFSVHSIYRALLFINIIVSFIRDFFCFFFLHCTVQWFIVYAELTFTEYRINWVPCLVRYLCACMRVCIGDKFIGFKHTAL